MARHRPDDDEIAARGFQHLHLALTFLSSMMRR